MDKIKAIDDLPKTEVNTGNIMSLIYTLAGLTAVGYVIYGGYLYVRAEGDVGKVRQARQTIFWAIMGLIVIIFAAVITNFIISGVEGAKK